MKLRYPFEQKSYAMRRMAIAIERAIIERTPELKERAARWAAAWGRQCGIIAKELPLPKIDFADAGESVLPAQDVSATVTALPLSESNDSASCPQRHDSTHELAPVLALDAARQQASA